MVTFRVQVHPRSHQERIKIVDDVLHIWVHAPPVEGAANKAIVEALANAVDAPRSSFVILRGTVSRYKQVECGALTEQEFWSRIKKALD